MNPLNRIYEAFMNGATICTDTRKITKGSLFFALRGPSFNGNQFAATALENGAAYAVVDEDVQGADERLIRVRDVLRFLQDLALHHRTRFSIPFIAITGSNGKTTTKELVNRVLSGKYLTLCTSGNLNNHIGVPLTLLSVRSDHEMAVIEMGANHQKEIELLCSIARPTHVLITNVGKAHLEGFGGFEGVKKGKGEMYEFAKANGATVFINDDNSHLAEMLGAYDRVFRYGTGSWCDVMGKTGKQGLYVGLEWKTRDEPEWHTVQSQITGSYNAENILAAIATGVHFNVHTDAINRAVSTYVPDNQRSQEIRKGGHHIILDAYNANPTSMEAALRNFNSSFSGKRAVLLGDMFELGDASQQEHSQVAALADSYAFDLLVLVGPHFKNVKGIRNARYFDTSTEAADWIRSQKLEGYTILIKGSRGSKMETLLDVLG